jgi:hypothetical protein
MGRPTRKRDSKFITEFRKAMDKLAYDEMCILFEDKRYQTDPTREASHE